MHCIAELNQFQRSKGPNCGSRKRSRAFPLVEVLFAMGIVGILVTALYAAIATSTKWVRACQEDEIATRIMSEKLDTIRLYNWDQMNSNGFIVTNFVVGMDPSLTNSIAYYTGRVEIVNALPATATEGYKTSLKKITVSVTWVSGQRPQNRSMTTFVSQYGLSSFVNK